MLQKRQLFIVLLQKTSVFTFCIKSNDPILDLSSKNLDLIRPISGHVLRVDAPWIKCVLAYKDGYIIPK